MPFEKGLDFQVSNWLKVAHTLDDIRLNSDKQVYVCCNTKYRNQLYWQKEIEENVLSKKSNDVPSEKFVKDDSGGKMSLTLFKENFEKGLLGNIKILLNYAITCRQNDFLNILIEAGSVDVNEIIDEIKGRRMIHLAVLNTDFLRLRYLIEHGANVNFSDYKVGGSLKTSCNLIFNVQRRQN
jgi:hypothetical protein